MSQKTFRPDWRQKNPLGGLARWIASENATTLQR
jgi:hypothetical protein